MSKDVEAGKFKTMDWLMKYVTRPQPEQAAATATCARNLARRPVWIFRKHDVNKDGRLDDENRLTCVRP